MDLLWTILMVLSALGLAVHTIRTATEVEREKRLGRVSIILLSAGAGLALIGEVTEWKYPIFGAILGTGLVELAPAVFPTVITSTKSLITRAIGSLWRKGDGQ